MQSFLNTLKESVLASGVILSDMPRDSVTAHYCRGGKFFL